MNLPLSRSGAESKKKFGMYRSLGVVSLVALLLISIRPSTVHGVYFSQGVLGFLRSLEITVAKRTLWFYRHFGMNVDPAKINQVRHCDYSNSDKIKFCPPVFNRRDPTQNPNLPPGTNFSYGALSSKSRPSFASIPSKCLEDPDDPECRKLRSTLDDASDPVLPGIGSINNNFLKMSEDNGVIDNAPTPSPNEGGAPHQWLSPAPSAPIGAVVSYSPTRYMCYGNHDSFKQAGSTGDEMTNVRGKWCESTMPSVSLEPSESPTVYPEGSQVGNETPSESANPTPPPTPKPSAVIEVPNSQPVMLPTQKPSLVSKEPSSQPVRSGSEEPTIDWEGPPGFEFKNPVSCD